MAKQKPNLGPFAVPVKPKKRVKRERVITKTTTRDKRGNVDTRVKVTPYTKTTTRDKRGNVSTTVTAPAKRRVKKASAIQKFLRRTLPLAQPGSGPPPDRKRHEVEVVEAATKAVNKTDKAMMAKNRRLRRLPGGRLAASVDPSIFAFDAAKSAWNAPDAVRAATYDVSRGKLGRVPSNVSKSLKNEHNVSGRQVVGEKWAKKHKRLGPLASGAVELVSEAPLAIATGGSGTIAQQASRTAARQTTKKLTKQAIKQLKVKKKNLPPTVRKDIDRKAQKVADEVHREKTARYGRQRDIYVGVDFKVPFSNKRVEKLVGLGQVPIVPSLKGKAVGVADLRAGARRALDSRERAGLHSGRRLRNAANRSNLATNTNAVPRTQPRGEMIQEAGRKKRATDELLDRRQHNTVESLEKWADNIKREGKDPHDEWMKVLDEVERTGPKSASPIARQLSAMSQEARSEVVKRGLDEDFLGQKLGAWDKRRLTTGAAGASRRQLKQGTKEARKRVGTERALADANRRNPVIGVKVRQATEGERLRIDRLKDAEKIAKNRPAYGEKMVGVLEAEHRGLTTKIRQRAVRQNFPKDPEKLAAVHAETRAMIERQRRIERVLPSLRKRYAGKSKGVSIEEARKARKQASAELDRSLRHDTKGRVERPLNDREVTRIAVARHGVKSSKQSEKRLGALVAEIKKHPGTSNIDETTQTLDRWIGEAEAIGATPLAKRLTALKAEKVATPAFHTPRRQVKASARQPAPPGFNRDRIPAGQKRQRRTLRVGEAANQRVGDAAKYDFSFGSVTSAATADRRAAAHSDFAREVQRNIQSDPVIPNEKGGWYVIDSKGVSRPQTSQASAQRLVADKTLSYDDTAKTVYLNDTTHKWLQRLSTPTHRPLDENDAVRYFRNMQGRWKKVAVATPQTRIKNIVGDTTRGTSVGGGRLKHSLAGTRLAGPKGLMARADKAERAAKRWETALNPAKADPKVQALRQKKVPGGTRTYGDYLDELNEFPVHESGLIRAEVEEGVVTAAGREGRSVLGKTWDKWNRLVSTLEAAPRASLYISLRESGLPPKMAFETTSKSLIDYTIASPAEELLRRSAVPFVVFRGRNAASYIARALRKPGKIAQYKTIFDTIGQLAGYENYAEFQKDIGVSAENLALPVGTRDGKKPPATVNLGIPFGDVLKMGKQVKEGRAGEAVGESLIFSQALEALAPRIFGNADTGYAQSSPVLGATVGKLPGGKKVLGLHEGEEFDGTKRKYLVSPLAAAVFGSLTPETGVVQRVSQAETGEDAAISASNIFTGLSAKRNKPFQGEIGRLTRQIRETENALKGKPMAKERKKLNKKLYALKGERTELYDEQARLLKRPRKVKSRGGGGFGGSSGFGGTGGFGSSGGF